MFESWSLCAFELISKALSLEDSTREELLP